VFAPLPRRHMDDGLRKLREQKGSKVPDFRSLVRSHKAVFTGWNASQRVQKSRLSHPRKKIPRSVQNSTFACERSYGSRTQEDPRKSRTKLAENRLADGRYPAVLCRLPTRLKLRDRPYELFCTDRLHNMRVEANSHDGVAISKNEKSGPALSSRPACGFH
jgi:hypothetical protein